MASRGMTQAELARKAGLSTGYVAMLATGKITNPRWSMACTIADALGVTLQEIRDLMESGAEA